MFEPTLLVSTVATAMVYTLAAFGLVVTYRVAGVFNLAFGYQAAFAAYLYWQFSSPVGGFGWNRILAALLVVLVCSPLIGLLLQQVLFRNRLEVLSAIIITLGLGVLVMGLIQIIWNPSQLRTVTSVFGAGFWRFGGPSVTQ